MWTNVFKIGGLNQISWFQFLPSESDLSLVSDRSVRTEQKDGATLLVLSAHLQLQKEGFLSTWTNSFVGPWDPSQGVHNPDEKIKLWLFIPGRHSSVAETAQAAVSRLRVVGSGLWLAPGDSEEVATALSQALRNCIERAMKALSYMRFGDVFSRCHPLSERENFFRRLQPTVEFVYAATEEAIFVHVIISAKYIRALSSDDMENVLRRRSSSNAGGILPVVIAPHGIRGRLSGCCPSDLVKQVYFSPSKVRALDGFPFQVAEASGCQLRGQSCYVEVTIDCSRNGISDASQRSLNCNRSLPVQHPPTDSSAAAFRGDVQTHVSSDRFPAVEITFIYPPEAVIVPVLRTAFARSSLKRFWLQNWGGASLFGSYFFLQCAGFGNADKIESASGPWIESSRVHSSHGYNSSSNSNNSSSSSISSTSSDSDYRINAGGGDLEADADSLACRRSGLSSNNQFENDGQQLVSKHAMTVTTESFGPSDTVVDATMQEAYTTDYASVGINNSAITGIANDQITAYWDWDDEDRGMGMDIQTLLSEFGDFGDFFESEVLTFGEPPGTAESQALIFSDAEHISADGSPCNIGMDATDQMILPVMGFPSLDGFNPPPTATVEDTQRKNEESIKDLQSSDPMSYYTAPSMSEFDQLSKTEALMTFAPEYRAVEISASEFSPSIFRNPYLPKSRLEESSHSSSNTYKYGATPPSCLDGLDEKSGVPSNSKACLGRDDGSVFSSKNYYTHVESGRDQPDRRLFASNNVTSYEEGTTCYSGFNSGNAVKAVQRKMAESALEAGKFLISLKAVLATDVECIMFQASMCKIRHTRSSGNLIPYGLSKSTGSPASDQLPGETSTLKDKISSKYEVKRKESIPVRIAGDADGGTGDRPLNAPVGVWRSVGVPKGSKPTNSPCIDISPSLTHNLHSEEGNAIYGQRQPLHMLLDAMAFIVQQATSSVDVALDADYGDGPYGWLALQEQQKRGLSCGPSMIHAGCGGTLAACHGLDIAGVELLDPLSANIQPSSVISLLHSDIKSALKSAFGNLDGPLCITDWCKGRGQSVDGGTLCDGFSAESTINESKDSSSNITLAVGDPLSPPQSSSSCLKVPSTIDGARGDETCQRRSNQEMCIPEPEPQARLRPTLFVLPLPAILVGYQDDWLKTSANSLQLWEKAPFEPYAPPKPMTYYVICPDIDPLTTAAADFFQQLGTVYETCKLGTHVPQNIGNQMDLASGKLSSSGFILLDHPQLMKIESKNTYVLGSISDYLLSLSNGWDLTTFLKSLSKALKSIKFGSSLAGNPKEHSSGPCTVIYVVCPFPEPIAVLQTVIESSTALGSVINSADTERRPILHSHVGKALSCSTSVDEALVSNVLTLSGFSLPKLVLQIVTVDAIFRVTSPAFNELILLKEISFTVYNKARRIGRSSSNELVHSSSISSRSNSGLMNMTSPISGMWKDTVTSRVTGQSLPREGELDAGLRPGSWDNSWQTLRAGGFSCDLSRNGDFHRQDNVRYMFEPLFILAEPGSVEHGVSPSIFGNLAMESSRPFSDDSSCGGFMQNSSSVGSADTGPCSLLEGSEPDSFGSGYQKTASLHCCYGWTEDWRWLVCIWTDSRGELLDSHIFPFGGISGRQDTKGLQCLFIQVLKQCCQILSCSSPDVGASKPRDIIITRIGYFFELECQEWQKAIYFAGGTEVKNWPLQLRQSIPDGVPASSNGASLQQQDISLIQERALPSSPSPSLYSPSAKSSGFVKGGLGQTNARKQITGGHTVVDSSRGFFQWVQSISLIGVSIDHSLQLIFQADTSSPGGTQGSSCMGQSGYLEGFSPVKSLGSTSASYILIPSPSMRYLPPVPLQLPTCLTAESPPLAHLLHSKGSAIPLSTGFVVSKAVPSIRKDSRSNTKEEWPSVLAVSLVDYYGCSNINQEKLARGSMKQGRSLGSESRDREMEIHLILESVAAELHALSWMTVSPAYLERRTALPFHCDMVLRLRRLLHFADKELSQHPERTQV